MPSGEGGFTLHRWGASIDSWESLDDTPTGPSIEV